jgi:hypothetical protein
MFSQLPPWFPDRIDFTSLFKHADHYWQRHHGFAGSQGWAVRLDDLPSQLPAYILHSSPIREIDPLDLYTQEFARVRTGVLGRRSGFSLVGSHLFYSGDREEMLVQVPGGDLAKTDRNQVAFVEQALKGQGEWKALRAADPAPDGYAVKVGETGELLGYARMSFIE